MGKTKICLNCDEKLDKSEFRRGQLVCMTCEHDPELSYEKTCVKCEETKPHTEFRHNCKKCKECKRSDEREYRRRTTKAKEWCENNKERMAELQKNWYETNKPYIREKEQERIKNDPIFCAIKEHRRQLNSFFRLKKKYSSQLQISQKMFRKWLEFQFDEGMCMDNYNIYWQLDHTIPLFTLYDSNPASDIIEEEDAKLGLFEWYNIAPLSIHENRQKSNSISRTHIEDHISRLDEFLDDELIDLEENENYQKYRQLVQRLLEESICETP